MFLHEPCYEIAQLANSNYHIHTTFSGCAKHQKSLREILTQAEKSGITRIAITDHSPTPSGDLLWQIGKLKKEYTKSKSGVEVLFGAELSAYGVGQYSETAEIRAKLDYRLFSYNHYHQDFWEHPQERTAEGYKQHAFSLLRTLFDAGQADCVAHPFYGRFMGALEDRLDATRVISDNELGDMLTLGTKAQVAFELNTGAVMSDPEFFHRYFQIGREVGAVFNLGTDAHRIEGVDTWQFVPQLEEILY